MTNRPRLTPPVADVRRAVRGVLARVAREATAADAPRTAAVTARPRGAAAGASASTSTPERDVAQSAPAQGGSAPAGSASTGSASTGSAPSAPLADASAVDANAPAVDLNAPAVDPNAPLVLVALSGGPDSLALAAGTAFEAPRAGLRAGAVVIDHGLQEGSAEVAAHTAAQARELGLDPVIVVRVNVENTGNGPEAEARLARYEALEATRQQLGAHAVLLGHTLDDQAETVLLGLARGSGGTSLHGMATVTGPLLRPLLGIRRSDTEQACLDQGLEPWHDPHNDDPRFTRVRVRKTVLPLLERELGPGISEALARTAQTLREDSETLDDLAQEWAREVVSTDEAGRIALDVGGIVTQPPALRQRICRIVAEQGFGVSLSRRHTMAVTALATEWRGQGAIDLPGIRVERERDQILFGAAESAGDDDAAEPRTASAPTGMGAVRETGARRVGDAERVIASVVDAVNDPDGDAAGAGASDAPSADEADASGSGER